jgi:hypothetical protein
MADGARVVDAEGNQQQISVGQQRKSREQGDRDIALAPWVMDGPCSVQLTRQHPDGEMTKTRHPKVWSARSHAARAKEAFFDNFSLIADATVGCQR